MTTSLGPESLATPNHAGKRVAPWIVAGVSILLAVPGIGLAALGGLLDLSAGAAGSVHESLDACGMPQNWFWEAYQNNTGWFEVALALVLGLVAVAVLVAALRRRLIATILLGALLVAGSAWPFVVQHERSRADGAMLIGCHDL